ncbi:MAG: carbohydrate ABC transporter permease, partial [Hoeflea sp.]|nr:carbohydrate ABC transporter permease [Hoeflea sp.]
MQATSSKKSPLVWAVHISVVLLVALWLFPTVGLFVSSFRTADQIAGSGWWNSLFTQERQRPAIRLSGDETQDGDRFVIEGRLFAADNVVISRWGINSREPEAYEPGEEADAGGGATLTVEADGIFRLSSPESFGDARLPRVFTTAEAPPEFTLQNYRFVLF